MTADTPTPLTYRDAGVDIEAGNALVDAIGPLAKATARAGVMGGLGGFGALFDLKAAGFGLRHRWRRYKADARLSGRQT